jgi:hypothetical protein
VTLPEPENVNVFFRGPESSSLLGGFGPVGGGHAGSHVNFSRCQCNAGAQCSNFADMLKSNTVTYSFQQKDKSSVAHHGHSEPGFRRKP